MKTLYITDLDGTLLNSNAELTQNSADIISSLIKKGVMFSVATARTKATVLDMFRDVGLNMPIALMNGVSVYDTARGITAINHSINKKVAAEILKIYSKHGKHPMLYFSKDDYLEIVYTEVDNIHQQEYITDRNNRKLKKFKQVKEYSLDSEEELLYIVSFDKPFELRPIYEEIKELHEVVSCFYSDNYTDCNFLETMNGSISKGTAAEEIKRLTGADRIIAFGDNLNDIPLFKVADEAYAVSEAHNELKKIATGIIGSNDNDAVAEFISKHSQTFI